MDTSDFRKPEYEIENLFLRRWSPRSFTGEEIPDSVLMSFFEAARWAPSSANNQPWRFIYAKRGSPEWAQLFNLLAPGNQAWCVNASVLIVMVSRKMMESNNGPNPTHSFDTGSAWENLSLQAVLSGWYTHGMAGFDYERARTDLQIPNEFQVEAMCAIGKLAPKENLPERYQSREFPSNRRPLSEIVFCGRFGGKRAEPSL